MFIPFLKTLPHNITLVGLTFGETVDGRYGCFQGRLTGGHRVLTYGNFLLSGTWQLTRMI